MLYERHYAAVSRIILGFVIASSLKILPTSFGDLSTLLISLVCFGGGFAHSDSDNMVSASENF
jgi:hypothetical protein